MAKLDIFDKYESGVRSYSRTFPCTLEQARGVELWDVNGNRYLDFLAGAGSLNYGHNNPVLKKALIEYIESDAITHSLDLRTQAKARFIDAMQNIILAPRGLDYRIQFTGPTGTNAVEAALKIARKVTGRSNIISFTNGFHGCSLGSLAVTGNKTLRAGAGMALNDTTTMPFDNYFGSEVDTIEYLDRLISDPSSGVELPAAVIVETVQGEGGLRAAGMMWLKRLQSLCKEKEILLIVDDIQAGCGRTGTFFSFEPAGLKPDIVTLSKSLSGYGLPFSVVLMKPELDIWKPGEHNGTFRGNNHAFITATAALELYWRTPEFAKSIRRKGTYLGKRLQKMVDRFPADIDKVCGRGMMRGLQCSDSKRAAAVTAKAFANGLIIERSGPKDEVIKCLMPLTINDAELKEGLDILERAVIDEYQKEAVRIRTRSDIGLPRNVERGLEKETVIGFSG